MRKRATTTLQTTHNSMAGEGMHSTSGNETTPPRCTVWERDHAGSPSGVKSESDRYE